MFADRYSQVGILKVVQSGFDQLSQVEDLGVFAELSKFQSWIGEKLSLRS